MMTITDAHVRKVRETIVQFVNTVSGTGHGVVTATPIVVDESGTIL